MNACVCVFNFAGGVGTGRNGKIESTDGDVCERRHRRNIGITVTILILTILYFASSSVSESNTFASTLLVLLGWS